MSEKPALGQTTVFMCNRGHNKSNQTTPIRVNASLTTFEAYKKKLKENRETTDVAFNRFMELYNAGKI